MVPTKTDSKWAALITGRPDCKFGNAAASLLLFRLQNDVQNDPSPPALLKAIDELHAFFTKHERTLEAELKTIFD